MKTSKYSLIHSHILLLIDGLDGKQRTERMERMKTTDGMRKRRTERMEWMENWRMERIDGTD